MIACNFSKEYQSPALGHRDCSKCASGRKTYIDESQRPSRTSLAEHTSSNISTSTTMIPFTLLEVGHIATDSAFSRSMVPQTRAPKGTCSLTNPGN